MATVMIIRALLSGDEVTVTGTVDGEEQTVRVWKSHLDTLSTRGQKVAYVAAQLKAMVPAKATTIDLAATVTL